MRHYAINTFWRRTFVGWVLLGLAFGLVGMEALFDSPVPFSKFAAVLGPVGLALITMEIVPRK